MSSPQPLTFQDTVLVNAMLAIVLPVVEDPKRIEMHLDIIRQARSRANAQHPLVGPLIEAADSLLIARRHAGKSQARHPERMAWSNARWQTATALARLSEWRLGEALAKLEERADG
ncbi:hypothetical protein [Pseudooceanicola sp.]|uniref:hypothetical protein n=1 Tax=Pseudooceanicola sp. TaxID=1914328 RepID=UPI0040593181